MQEQAALQQKRSKKTRPSVGGCLGATGPFVSSGLHPLVGRLQHSTIWQGRVPRCSCRLKASCALSSLHAETRCSTMHSNKSRDYASSTWDLLGSQKAVLHAWRLCALQGYRDSFLQGLLTAHTVSAGVQQAPRIKVTSLADPWAGAQAAPACMAPADSIGVLSRRHTAGFEMVTQRRTTVTLRVLLGSHLSEPGPCCPCCCCCCCCWGNPGC